MSHASMAGYFLFFYNRYRKEEILKRKEEKLMSLLEVKNVNKGNGTGRTCDQFFARTIRDRHLDVRLDFPAWRKEDQKRNGLCHDRIDFGNHRQHHFRDA